MKRLLNIIMIAACCSLLLTACSREEDSDSGVYTVTILQIYGEYVWAIVEDVPEQDAKVSSKEYICFLKSDLEGNDFPENTTLLIKIIKVGKPQMQTTEFLGADFCKIKLIGELKK